MLRKMLITTNIALLMLLVHGCSLSGGIKDIGKGAADVAKGIASVPHCRIEYTLSMPLAVQVAAEDDLNLLDAAFDDVIGMALDTPSLTFEQALLDVAGIPTTVDDLTLAYRSVVGGAREYLIAEDLTNPTLRQCDADITAGWQALTGSSPAMDFVRAWSPYVQTAHNLKEILDKDT